MDCPEERCSELSFREWGTYQQRKVRTVEGGDVGERPACQRARGKPAVRETGSGFRRSSQTLCSTKTRTVQRRVKRGQYLVEPTLAALTDLQQQRAVVIRDNLPASGGLPLRPELGIISKARCDSA